MNKHFAIYHANDMMAMIMPDAQRWLFHRRENYTYVGSITAALGDVFALANHSEDNVWTERKEVSQVPAGTTPRPTSVGDVLYSLEMHRAYLIVGDGYQEIDLSVLDEGKQIECDAQVAYEQEIVASGLKHKYDWNEWAKNWFALR